MRHSRNIAGEAKKTLKKVSSLGSTVNARRNRRFLAWWQTQDEIFYGKVQNLFLLAFSKSCCKVKMSFSKISSSQNVTMKNYHHA